jgi:hypothetical protein
MQLLPLYKPLGFEQTSAHNNIRGTADNTIPQLQTNLLAAHYAFGKIPHGSHTAVTGKAWKSCRCSVH